MRPHLVTSQEPGFVITAPQGAKAGAQLLASYGAKDHSEFFRVYGFADEHAPREVVFHVDLERRDPLRGLRQAALLEINAYRTFTIRSGEDRERGLRFQLTLDSFLFDIAFFVVRHWIGVRSCSDSG